MLSREERILADLLVSRGVTSREAIERCARIKEVSPLPISLVDALIDSGAVDRTAASPLVEEARSIDHALEPRLPGGGTLGDFRLIREIGRGGMGIVYEAVQKSLSRRVALKILPAGAAMDERLATRFVREARAAGRLDHPGIVRVYTSGLADGVFYFAMELIEGHSLAEEVRRGPAVPERAARIVAQVASAVEHAHLAGLVHRDIKPENILMGPDDQPRLTDFGLVHEALADSFTLSLHVLGTPAYIPLEQALGEAVDSRSDVYSLGAVLYTLLCGRPPYDCGVPSLVLARLLGDAPPPLLTVRPEIPAELAVICEKAMARRPEGRYARASEMAADLERFDRGEPVTAQSPPAAHTLRAGEAMRVPPGLAEQHSTHPAHNSQSRTHRPSSPKLLAVSLVALAVLSILTIAGVSLFTMRSKISEAQAPGLPPYVPFGPIFRLVTRSPGKKWCPALSPDGAILAFDIGRDKGVSTYLQTLEEGPNGIVAPSEPLKIERVEGGDPSFSPDGKFLALGSLCQSRGQGCLAILGLHDATLRLLPVQPGTSSWSPDGREIAFVGYGGRVQSPLPGGSVELFSVDATTGVARMIRNGGLSMPSYSPHGRRIGFALKSGGQSDLWTVAPGGEDMVRVTDDPEMDWNPVWSPDGARLYFGSERDGKPGLWKVAVNEATGHPMGIPEPVSDRLFAAPFFLSLSANGKTMVVAPMEEKGLLVRLSLDPDAGAPTAPPTVFPRCPAHRMSPSPSPDGRMLAVAAQSKQVDIAVLPTDGSDEPRFLTDDTYRDDNPRWSPDGTLIAFDSDRSGKTEIWTIRPDGSDLRQVTHTKGRGAASPVWSPDGKLIAYSESDGGAFVIGVGVDTSQKIAAFQDVPSEPVARPGAEEREFVPNSWSPDGTTLAGSLKGIVLCSMADGRYRRLTSFGEKPVWLPDGQRLLFTSDRKIYRLSVKTGDVRVVFSAEPSDLSSTIGVSSDGRAIYASLTSSGEEIWMARIGD